ncbi:MAG: hypothetical protein ACRC62_39460 [Microcoleus sp.]
MNKKTKELLAIAERSGDWSIYLMGFSPQEQLILKAIANTPKTTDEVARKIIQSPRSIQSAVNLLLRHKILIRQPQGYAVANANFAAYLAKTRIVLDKDKVAIEVHNAVSRALCPLLEGLDEQGMIEVNGNYLTGMVSDMATDLVMGKWRDL